MNKLPKNFELIEIVSAERVASAQTYDIEIETVHAFTARHESGLESVSHNSATICVFSPDDSEMLNAKVGDWFYENPQRARSNNSAMLLRGKTSFDEFKSLMKSVRHYGEPGFVWADSREHMFNPCITGDAIIPIRYRGTTQNVTLEDLVDRFKSSEFGSIEVLSYDTNAGVREYKMVTDAAMTRKNTDVITIHCKNGSKVRCTPDHQIWTDNAGYIDAIALKTSDVLQSTNGATSIVNIEFHTKHEDVYDITVEDNHNFFANDILVHNCVEIGMLPKTEDGRSGIQYCNLTEMNGRKCKDRETFLRLCRMSAIIGTIQAGYDSFPYLGKASEEIVRREALLGCSITGWMDNPDLLFNAELQREGAKLIKKVNRELAPRLGLNVAARCTCSKPSGTTSCVLQTASGIHPHHSRRYIRNVQGNINEFSVQEFSRQNPIAVEDSVWDAQKKDKVLSFMCEVPAGAVVKNMLSPTELLDRVKLTQQNWVEHGTNKKECVDVTLRHNVSNTITVKEDEWDEVTKYIYENRAFFAGISLLPASGDLDYPQAPFINVLAPNELIKEYGDASLLASGLIVDGLKAFDNNLWLACDVVLDKIEDADVIKDVKMLAYPEEPTPRKLANYFARKDEYETSNTKKEWLRRVKQFATRHFEYDPVVGSDKNGNDLKLKKCCACLKHVSIHKRWVDLKREYVEIDWAAVSEESNAGVDVDTMGAQACAGGKCEL